LLQVVNVGKMLFDAIPDEWLKTNTCTCVCACVWVQPSSLTVASWAQQMYFSVQTYCPIRALKRK